ncbi:piggyBac transposable element-derived protein 3-like [Schistocerca piceifrons]|uniref:piggyBac transposable element-derived protein 3-like n=1 Tax=Schistocerca piceifrons TaxID=274613 RepID=UPI001F5ECDF3|nr:piggyBac transposable element-derived protein 3-like [Schistocerca piceifrons]
MSLSPIAEEKELKNKGRGPLDYRIDESSNILVVRWYDNKAVQLVSTYAGINPQDKYKRWSKKDNQSIQVNQPLIVKEYNEHMGGVDLADMLTELYRINARSKKWYMRIVYWCFNVAVVNSWLFYRRHLNQRGATSHISLLDFHSHIASGLTIAGNVVHHKRGRPSTEDMQASKRKLLASRSIADVRYDEVGHWPQQSHQKGRCKLCPKGFSRVSCIKCKVFLCITSDVFCNLP